MLASPQAQHRAIDRMRLCRFGSSKVNDGADEYAIPARRQLSLTRSVSKKDCRQASTRGKRESRVLSPYGRLVTAGATGALSHNILVVVILTKSHICYLGARWPGAISVLERVGPAKARLLAGKHRYEITASVANMVASCRAGARRHVPPCDHCARSSIADTLPSRHSKRPICSR